MLGLNILELDWFKFEFDELLLDLVELEINFFWNAA